MLIDHNLRGDLRIRNKSGLIKLVGFRYYMERPKDCHFVSDFDFIDSSSLVLSDR